VIPHARITFGRYKRLKSYLHWPLSALSRFPDFTVAASRHIGAIAGEPSPRDNGMAVSNAHVLKTPPHRNEANLAVGN
jgi:hypothetical protein